MNDSNNTPTERIARDHTEDVPTSDRDHRGAAGSGETILAVTVETDQSRHSEEDT